MNRFDERVGGCLRARGVEVLQVNVGLRCNQRCAHCHVEASPDRTEEMPWRVMEGVVAAAGAARVRLVDVTGGAPELNPDLERFIAALRGGGVPVQVRTNLTVLLEPGQEGKGAFFREHGVALLASLPCCREEDLAAQRGAGVLGRSVEALRHLNALGYGVDPALRLTLVCNPLAAELPAAEALLEADFRRELERRFGIRFTRLATISNVPLGRFRRALGADGARAYADLLERSFNPATIDRLMCRTQVSVRWDGALHDCDFNLAAGLKVDHGAPDDITRFDVPALAGRRIVTAPHCFACTAGAGST